MIDNGQWNAVRKEAKRQGWTITATKRGYLLLAPDGEGKATRGTPR
jgi:hypothetical protein